MKRMAIAAAIWIAPVSGLAVLCWLYQINPFVAVLGGVGVGYAATVCAGLYWLGSDNGR